MRKIHELFAGRDDAYGTYDLIQSSGKKVGIKGRPVWEPVNEKVWSKHLRGEQPLGMVPVRLDGTVNWFAIDVDDYETDNLHVKLAKDIKRNGLPLLVFSTKSGGAHLYCFLTAPMEAKIARQVAARFVSALNLPETTEIFPKQDKVRKEDLGSWINMPYYGNERKCLGLAGDTPLNLEEFLYVASQAEIHPDELTRVKKEAPPEPDDVPDGHDEAPPCVQHMIANGVGEGGRNNSLLHMGIYLKRAFPDDFEGKLHDWNGTIDDPLPYREVNTIIGQLHKKEYQYLCKQQPMESLCNKSACLKRKYGVGEKSEDSMPVFNAMSVRKVGEDIYYLTLEGGYTVRLDHDQIMNHRHVVSEVFRKHNVLFERLTDKHWFPMLNSLMADAVLEPAPAEVCGSEKIVAAFREWVARKISQGSNDLNKGGVSYNNKKLSFKGKDLVEYINRIYGDLSDKDVWAALNEDGAHARDKNVWVYPVKEEWFEVEDERQMF